MTAGLLVILAFGLAMDAFAVSVTNGMCYRMHPLKNALSSGLAFGVAQGLMPLFGYFAGHSFAHVIESVDHWVALVLLGLIGGKMVYESLLEMIHPEDCITGKPFRLQTLTVQSIATSIDALAVGISLGVMQVDIVLAVSVIGVVTFGCSFVGVLIGRRFGDLLKSKAALVGGLVLVGIGINIFLEHLHPHFH